MRGWWHVQRFTREDFAIAMPLFRRAAELDPEFALPHVGLTMIRLFEAVFHWAAKPADALADSLASARAALALDALDSLAHACLGTSLSLTGKHDDAVAACRRAIELNPSNVLAYVCLATAHVQRGEPEAGIRAAETAVRLGPNDMWLQLSVYLLSSLHYLARDYAKAAEAAKLAVQCAPQYPLAWRGLANALGQLGRLDEAREALTQFLLLAPNYTSEQAVRATVTFRDEAVFQHYLEGLRKAGWTG
jgi:adenylate cyclase